MPVLRIDRRTVVFITVYTLYCGGSVGGKLVVSSPSTSKFKLVYSDLCSVVVVEPTTMMEDFVALPVHSDRQRAC
jgi:hypothetical protein